MEKEKILYIEDEIHNIKHRMLMLVDNGYDVKEAIDVKSALEKLESERYDLILLDIMMPRGIFNEDEANQGYETGIPLTRKIKEGTNKDTPIIVITANPSTYVKAKLEEIGIDSYLTKPVHQIELEKEIESVLGIK